MPDEAPTAVHPLERLLRPLDPVTVVDGRDLDVPPRAIASMGGRTAPIWLSSGDWRLFVCPSGGGTQRGKEEIARFAVSDGRTLTARFDPERESVFVPFSLAEAYRNYISEAWTVSGSGRRLSAAQLSLFYRAKRFVPRSWQLQARRLLIRWQGLPTFPSWPHDASVARLLRFYAFCLSRVRQETELSFRWFWPRSHTAAMILTHDVEGPEGLRLAIELADLEEELGLRSSFNLGAWYEPDPGILRELTDRGFEIGMHGLVHDRSLFESRSSFDEQQPGLVELKQRLGAEGFRSPATHRVFDWIAELPISYDCTLPNSDPYEPQPGGCCSAWPFFIGPIVELPYTLPQDHTVLTLLGHRSAELWLQQAERIEREHGLIQCVSHPDPGYLGNPEKRAVYAEFLRAMAGRDRLWKPLPRDVARWWRQRDATVELLRPISRGIVRIGETIEDVVFALAADVEPSPP